MKKNNDNAFTKESRDLVFLHGYLSNSKSFSYQIPFFERDFNVYAPDFKGFGDNKGMDYPYSLDDYILELREYFYKNNIVNPNIVAHSFGGRVTLKLVYSGERVDKLVLTGCAGLKPKFSIKKSCKKTCFNILKKLVGKDRLTGFYSSDYLALSPIMKQSFIKIVNEHLDYTLDKIQNQTLIIFGDQDRETPLYMAKKLNDRIKNSTLSIYKGAGHFCFIDKPLKFNTEVKEFLLSK